MDDDTAGNGEHTAALATVTDKVGRHAGERPAPSVLFAAIEATHTPMVISDPQLPDNPIVFANRAFRELSGYENHEIIGRNCRFLQGSGSDPADVRAIRDAIDQRREITRDLLNYRKDGTGFVNELHVSPIFDEAGELLYFFGSQNDLGRYRHDWNRLQESEERYRSLFEAIEAGFCVFEMLYDAVGTPIDYRFVEVNPAFEAQTGLVDAIGRSIRDLAPGHEQHWMDLYGRVDRERRGVRFENEARALGRHYEVYAYPVGQPEDHRVAALFTDVTDRKRAEADLRALNETLENQVAERTRELTEASEALRQSQKMEAIGQLTGGIAHDFNNLLTIIGSAAEFLARPDLKEDRRQRYVAAITDTTQRAAALTGQLLAFARRQPLRAEAFDVEARVQGVVALVRPLLGQGVGVEVETRLESRVLAQADPSQFDTALVNLAVNARDAMAGHGTLTIRVELRDGMPAVRHHPARAGQFVEVQVADTGSGIAPEDVGRIFEPFFTTKEVGKGTGLGLSQVFGFVKQTGGDVDVQSSPAGTRFTIFLPAAAAEAVEDASISDGTERMPANARILVVEDNAEVGRFCTELLHDMGLQTVWVQDAATAMDRLRASPDEFDMVFSDVMMPGMSGLDLAREVRATLPDVPVVLTTGYSSVLADEGAHDFPLVRKPYSVASLSEVLGGALQGRIEDQQ